MALVIIQNHQLLVENIHEVEHTMYLSRKKYESKFINHLLEELHKADFKRKSHLVLKNSVHIIYSTFILFYPSSFFFRYKARLLSKSFIAVHVIGKFKFSNPSRLMTKSMKQVSFPPQAL